MTQKATFTREMIIEAAFVLMREVGWAGVTARTIAQRLGSSTMPLYSSLKSMDEVEKEVRAKAEALMHDYQRRPFADERLHSSAVGYVVFARDEPHAFRFLFFDRPLTMPVAGNPLGVASGTPTDVNAVGGVVNLADQAATALRDPVVLKSWAFTHGLASLISSKVIDLPTERIASLLLEAGTAFYMTEEMRKAKGERNE